MPPIDWNWVASVVIAPSVVAAIVSGGVNVYLARGRERSDARIATLGDRLRLYREFDEKLDSLIPLLRFVTWRTAETDELPQEVSESIDKTLAAMRAIAKQLMPVNAESGDAAIAYCNQWSKYINVAREPPGIPDGFVAQFQRVIDAGAVYRQARDADLGTRRVGVSGRAYNLIRHPRRSFRMWQARRHQ